MVALAGRGRQNSWPDIDQLGIPCHTHHTQFKAWRSRRSHSLHPWLASEEDPAPWSAFNPDPDFDLCIPESSSHLLLGSVWDFLVPSWQLLVGCQPPCHPALGNSVSVFSYFALFLWLLVLLVLLLLLIKLF